MGSWWNMCQCGLHTKENYASGSSAGRIPKGTQTDFTLLDIFFSFVNCEKGDNDHQPL